MLKKGYLLPSGGKVKRIMCSGDNFCLVMDSRGSYALCASKDLLDYWTEESYDVENLFGYDPVSESFILEADSSSLISKLDEGPFPDNWSQIEAFSHSFSNSRKNHPNSNLNGGIYIEKYSIILPLEKYGENDYGTIYGIWITGGVNVSIDSFSRVCDLVSWVNRDFLANCASIAGFEGVGTVLIDGSNAVSHPSTNSAGSNEIPDQAFSLPGKKDLEFFLNDSILDIIRNIDAYEKMGVSFPGATLLYGPPGCGKTFAVTKFAEFLGWPVIEVNSSSIGSPYIHETGKKISEAFDSAISSAPSVLIIDEMESFLSARSNTSSQSFHLEEMAEFLRKIPEASSKHVLIFGMTNMLESIDPAILRRGRFDHIIEVKMATEEEIIELLESKARNLPIGDDVDFSILAERLAGRPLSDVAFVLREAGKNAVKRGLRNITMSCFDSVAIESEEKPERKIKIGFQLEKK